MPTTANPLSQTISTGFSGLWLPLITPFRAGAVDHPALARLTRHYRQAGVSGFVACGSTGEAASLDDGEQLAVLDTVLEAADGLPVVMGLSGYHLPQTLAWINALRSRPIAGLLVPAPHYIRPSQAGLIHWFGTIADAAPAPLILYDIPYRTGSRIELATLLALAGHPNIRAVKDCGGDAGKTQALIADGRLQVLAGEDGQIFSTLALGGAGAIAASAHLGTEKFAKVMQLLEGGALAEARQLWNTLTPLINALFAEPNPASIKAALAHQGWIENELRAPMMPAELPVNPDLLKD
ncbi:MAG: 4-hydroxy-tetrahydrodipicolinate synthase [Polaromonas sp.]|nr:4-hydroxy-tetrahydrodipicolinate synthase [Polaromonas sp.]